MESTFRLHQGLINLINNSKRDIALHARHDGNASSMYKEMQMVVTLEKKTITQSQFCQSKQWEPIYDTTPTDFAGLPPSLEIFSKCGEQTG